MTSQELKLPWVHKVEDEDIDPVFRVNIILDADGDIVLDNEPWYPHAVKPAHQKEIVKRVNAHDKLVAALRKIATQNEIYWARTIAADALEGL